MNTKIKRGDILRATNGQHKGDYYLFARTCGGNSKNVMGQEIPGTETYAYNLFNLSSGKARQTDDGHVLVSWKDGVNYRFDLCALEKHFGMTFELATDMVTIGPKVTEVIAKQEVQDEGVALVKDFMKAMADVLNVGFNPAPVRQFGQVWVH